MNFEQPPIPEKKQDKIVKLSQSEREVFANRKVDDPELLKLMEEKGISFDSGDIAIESDGIKGEMTTKKEDFGTGRLEKKEESIERTQENEKGDIDELVINLQKKFPEGQYVNESGNKVRVVHGHDENDISITFNRLEKIENDKIRSVADFFFSKKWNRMDDVNKLEEFMTGYKRI